MTPSVWLPITKLRYGVIVGTPEHELTIEPVFCMLPAWHILYRIHKMCNLWGVCLRHDVRTHPCSFFESSENI